MTHNTGTQLPSTQLLRVRAARQRNHRSLPGGGFAALPSNHGPHCPYRHGRGACRDCHWTSTRVGYATRVEDAAGVIHATATAD